MRIGVGLGARTKASEPAALGALVDALVGEGFDSLWMSERLGGAGPDPVTALAWACGRAPGLKVGTSVSVLPGRQPAPLAQAFATLDRLSGGNFHPAVGLGAVDPREQSGFGVERGDRASIFDEMLPLLRRLWSGEPVTHSGRHFQLNEVRVKPTPIQAPLEVWLGGRSPAELRRVGRLGDGWLPSFCTAEDVADGWAVVNETASEHGRQIDGGHLGVLIAYSTEPLPEELAAFITRRRPDIDVAEIVPNSPSGVRARLEEFIDVGATKFVLTPLTEPDDWAAELRRLAGNVLDLQEH